MGLHSMFNTALVVAGLIGLWIIWSEVFPAFRIFDDDFQRYQFNGDQEGEVMVSADGTAEFEATVEQPPER